MPVLLYCEVNGRKFLKGLQVPGSVSIDFVSSFGILVLCSELTFHFCVSFSLYFLQFQSNYCWYNSGGPKRTLYSALCLPPSVNATHISACVIFFFRNV